ncbi:PAS domain S-box protein [Luteolibacter soli]
MQYPREVIVAIYSCGPAGKIQSYNEAARRLWGGIPGDTPWSGAMRFLRMDGSPVPIDDLPPCRAWQTQAVVTGVFMIETSSGTRFPMTVHAELQCGADGHPAGVTVLITESRTIQPDPSSATPLPFENPSPVIRVVGIDRIGFANPAAEALLQQWNVSSGAPAPALIQRMVSDATAHGAPLDVEKTIGDRTYFIKVVPVADGVHANLYFTDITELKKLEHHLRCSQERFDALALHSPVATYIKDADGRYTQANPVACRYLGAVGDVVGLTDEDLLPPEMAALLHENDQEVIRLGQTIVSEEQVGRWRFLTSKFPLPDENGNLTQVGGVSVEITERAEIERKLRESEERFRILTDNAPVGIFLSSADGQALFVNRAWCTMAGMTTEKALGTGWTGALHPEDRERVTQGWDHAVDQHMASYSEFRFLHADGSVVWVHGCALQLTGPDGELTGYIGSCVDVTERMSADLLLQRQSARLRLLWEAAGVILSTERPDVMLQKLFEKISPHLELDAFFSFMVDPSGDDLALFSCSGITEEQKSQLGRLSFGQAICGTVALRREPMVVSCIQQSDDEMASLVRGYGVSVYACNPLMAGGELLGTLSFASRTRTHFDADEIEFLETITHSFTGAYVRWRLLEDLRSADRKKDEFLATLAHELRNPLAPIRTGLEVMKMAGGLSAPLEKVRATMERQMDQLVTLVNDLIDVSRITRGKLQLRLTQCRFADIVRSATEASLPGIIEAGHYLDVSVPDAEIHLNADPHRLAQVISNLLNNAAKYTPRGGTIRLAAEVGQGTLSVRVQDTGKGIPSGMLDRIFEMFAQIESPTQDHGGLGIGLTLVKSLIQMHGGSVRAESAGPGKGSTFHLQLPAIIREPAPAPSLAVAGNGHHASGKRVLIVDDNTDAAQVLAMAVTLMGHEVATAENGQVALDLVPGFRPHVVFMDLGMPVMDGWEAAKRLRAQPGSETIHLVALTGWGQDGDRERTRAAGFDQHLVKPADPETLRRVLLESAP